MVHALRFLAAFLFGGGVLAAAQPAQSQSVRFAVFSSRPITDLEFAPGTSAAAQKLVFYAMARSRRYEFRGTMPLRFTDTKGRVLAEATIPPEITDALLVFSPLETPSASGLRYEVAVRDDSASRHGAGGLAVVNLSGLDLSGNIGPHAVLLKAGDNPALPVGRSARIALRAAFKGKTHPSYNDSVELGAGQRALLILFPPYEKDSFEVRSRLLIDEPTAVPGEAGERPKGRA